MERKRLTWGPLPSQMQASKRRVGHVRHVAPLGRAWRSHRLAVALLAAAGFAGTAQAAGNTTGPGAAAFTTFEEAIDNAFTRMERVMRPCIARGTGRGQVDVRFLGIPSKDPRVSEGLRDEINARVVAVINRTSPYVANPTEVSALIPTLLPGTDVGRGQLLEALNNQVEAPLVAMLEPTRPTAGVVSLKFRLLGRNASGIYGCPQQRLVHVATRDLTPVSRPPRDLDIKMFDGFLRTSYGQFAEALHDAGSLELALDQPFAGVTCPDLQNILLLARGEYFRFRRDYRQLNLSRDHRLPALSQFDAAAGTGAASAAGSAQSVPATDASGAAMDAARVSLRLRLVPHPTQEGVLTAGLTVLKGRSALDAAFSEVILDRPVPLECFTPRRDTQPDASDRDGSATSGASATGGTDRPDGEATPGPGDGGAPTPAGTPTPGGNRPAFATRVPKIVPIDGKCITFHSERYEDDVCVQPGDRIQECAACPELVVIPGGTVTIGSPVGEPGRTIDEGPQVEIGVAQPLAFGRLEITRAQFRTFLENSGYRPEQKCWIWQGAWLLRNGMGFERPGIRQDETHPAVCISWDDASAYIAWLNEGLQLLPGQGYRLPSEAEWEYAARAGAAGRGYRNNLEAARIARFRVDGNLLTASTTVPAGSKPANRFGLHDMLGNVWEWTQDCWFDTLDDMPRDGAARVHDGCIHRVLRGGSWNDRIDHIRVAGRSRTEHDNHSQDVGFRVVRPLFVHPQ